MEARWNTRRMREFPWPILRIVPSAAEPLCANAETLRAACHPVAKQCGRLYDRSATGVQGHGSTGRALQEGYVVCIPGTRGFNSKVGDTCTGVAPNGLCSDSNTQCYLRYYHTEFHCDTYYCQRNVCPIF